MADEQKLGIGSVVRLRSGGPAMTIEQDMGADWHCIWFADSAELQRGTFSESDLVSAEPDSWPRGAGRP